MMHNSDQKADIIESLKMIGARYIAPAFIAAGISALTAYFVFIKENRELDIRMVELSLSILKGEFKDDQISNPIHARRFALRVLEKFSGVEIDDDELENWAKGGGVPFDQIAPMQSWDTVSHTTFPPFLEPLNQLIQQTPSGYSSTPLHPGIDKYIMVYPDAKNEITIDPKEKTVIPNIKN